MELLDYGVLGIGRLLAEEGIQELLNNGINLYSGQNNFFSDCWGD